MLNSMKFGLKTLMKRGGFGALTHLNNLRIGKANFGKDDDIDPDTKGLLALAGGAFVFIMVLLLVLAVLGWVAVGKICKGTDDRSKNIRLGLYALLFFTGGTIGPFYLVLWMLQVNVCG